MANVRLCGPCLSYLLGRYVSNPERRYQLRCCIKAYTYIDSNELITIVTATGVLVCLAILYKMCVKMILHVFLANRVTTDATLFVLNR